MTIYSGLKEASNLTGKVLVCRRRHYHWAGSHSREWEAGDLLLVLSHERVKTGASWAHNDIVRFFLNGVSGTITIDSYFDDNWGVVEPEENLKGKSFVFTGALEHTRSYYKTVVEMSGGTFSGSVSNKTDYLVVADKNTTSTKAQKARALGVTLLSEHEFLELIRKGV
jgi:NAD-dependent DNA ligase